MHVVPTFFVDAGCGMFEKLQKSYRERGCGLDIALTWSFSDGRRKY
jgi:hypothetical protein